MSSSAAIYTPPNNLLQFVSVKLEGPSSYLNWSSQIEDALSIHDLLCYVDGTESSQCFSSPSISNVNRLKRQLQGLQQGGLNWSNCGEHAKAIADQLVAIGKPVDEADLISPLNTDYTPFVSYCYFAQREKHLSLFDFQSELFAFETLLESQQRSMQIDHNKFVMMAHKLGEGQHFTSPPNLKYYSRNRNGNVGSSNNEQSFTNTERVPAWANNLTFDPYVCQICGKRNHMAFDCFHRYDYNYQGRHPP
ncbi:hypothetical protein SADUNF_Sadunf10G0150300 [Salix dunnii]|uniref:Retrotransposon Copia-like N-terminal domain-containing protein n=1 Tax=Salix dunnii TaxID=1413687 RepID=A0A835MQ08_9ROSI|nr:hypothetical protein SADUNF_Sadunf10G0150300 [Salix dunnii]